jgi:hypothetical protein
VSRRVAPLCRCSDDAEPRSPAAQPRAARTRALPDPPRLPHPCCHLRGRAAAAPLPHCSGCDYGLRQSFYGLEFTFTDLLRDSPYITKDPALADYFYVPVLLYWGLERDVGRIITEMRRVGCWPGRVCMPGCCVGPRRRCLQSGSISSSNTSRDGGWRRARAAADRAHAGTCSGPLRPLRRQVTCPGADGKQTPCWDRKENRDHIWVAVNDFGACELPHEARVNSTIIHHWGRVHDLTSHFCRALKAGAAGGGRRGRCECQDVACCVARPAVLASLLGPGPGARHRHAGCYGGSWSLASRQRHAQCQGAGRRAEGSSTLQGTAAADPPSPCR